MTPMTVYKGPATVVTGTARELVVWLTLEVSAEPVEVPADPGRFRLVPLRSWSGEGYLPARDWSFRDRGEGVLRMPDGREGKIVITSARLNPSDPDGAVLAIAGMGGPPPLDVIL